MSGTLIAGFFRRLKGSRSTDAPKQLQLYTTTRNPEAQHPKTLKPSSVSAETTKPEFTAALQVEKHRLELVLGLNLDFRMFKGKQPDLTNHRCCHPENNEAQTPDP